MNPYKPTGFATPFRGMQAPDHLALEHTTQFDPGEVEVKFYPLQKIMKPLKPRMKTDPIPLPSFPFGVVPTRMHQQLSDLNMRGFQGPMVNHDGSMISADLADAFAQLADAGKRVPAPLSNEFMGSQWEYGPRMGRPFGTTDGSNFVLEYQGVLRETELERRAAKLIREGHDAKRVMRAMEEEVDNHIREKLRHR